MANLDNKLEQAYILSDKALDKPSFDTEAFIVASLLKLMGYKQDLVPESQIDEMTDTSKDLFVEYMHNKSIDNLNAYLMQIYQMISELYHTVDAEGKDAIKSIIAKMENIM